MLWQHIRIEEEGMERFSEENVTLENDNC